MNRGEVIRLLKGYRTMIVFGLQGIVYFFTWDKLGTIIDPFYIVEGNVVAALLLRWLTTTPVGEGE